MSQDIKMEWLMDRSIVEDADVSMACMTVPAGVTSDCHRHSNCTETIHLLSGAWILNAPMTPQPLILARRFLTLGPA